MLTIYTKTTCGYCVMLKKLLAENDIAYEEVNIEENDTARRFIQEAGHKTVPQIYNDGNLFVEGGYMGFKKYLEEKNNTQNMLDSLGGI